MLRFYSVYTSLIQSRKSDNDSVHDLHGLPHDGACTTNKMVWSHHLHHYMA
jgi:hypothetical protein